MTDLPDGLIMFLALLSAFFFLSCRVCILSLVPINDVFFPIIFAPSVLACNEAIGPTPRMFRKYRECGFSVGDVPAFQMNT